jgi:antitoxin component YwqK of YwqJK toxin-antitoxin module
MKYLFLLFPCLLFAQTQHVEYHDNGNVFREYFIKNKTLDSTFVQYYKNGIVKSTSNYHCGVEQGNFVDYRPNGSIEYNEFYHEGNLVTEREYHENGVLKLFIQYIRQNMYSENPRMVSYVQTEFRADSTIKNTK